MATPVPNPVNTGSQSKMTAAEQAEMRIVVNGLAEERLAAQITVLCSSDARAAGILSAAVAVAGAALAAYLAVHALPILDRAMLSAVCFGSGATAAVSGGFALWAVWPIDITLPGYGPKAFDDDWSKSKADFLAGISEVNAQKIATNLAALSALHRRSRAAMAVLLLTPVAGVAGALTHLLGPLVAAGFVVLLGFTIFRSFGD